MKEFWQQKWKDNDIKFNQDAPNHLLIEYLSDLNLTAGDRIFVPLCGKSVDMLYLVSQGYQVVGVELSRVACESFFEENKIAVDISEIEKFTVFQNELITLYSGDIFDLDNQLLGHVDAIFDRAALIALPEKLRQRYVDKLTQLLKPEGQMLLISSTYNQCEMEGPPFSVDEQEVASLFSASYTIKTRYNKLAPSIPEHLRARGLTQASEQVYHLTLK